MKINMYKYLGIKSCIIGIIWTIYTIIIQLNSESATHCIEWIISALLILLGITLLSIDDEIKKEHTQIKIHNMTGRTYSMISNRLRVSPYSSQDAQKQAMTKENK